MHSCARWRFSIAVSVNKSRSPASSAGRCRPLRASVRDDRALVSSPRIPREYFQQLRRRSARFVGARCAALAPGSPGADRPLRSGLAHIDGRADAGFACGAPAERRGSKRQSSLRAVGDGATFGPGAGDSGPSATPVRRGRQTDGHHLGIHRPGSIAGVVVGSAGPGARRPRGAGCG